jgi:multidrug efflux pump subunit AcrA (membrane-fusion protein)
MPAEIKPDAFSDSIYSAEVLSVANLAVNKDRDSKIKVFPVDILIKSNSENLMPGLTVSCRIIVDKIDDVIFVPLEAMNAESQTDFVYVKNNNGFEKREVETGQRNTDYVIIKRGLKANEKVAMINPYAQSEESQKQ